MTTANLTVIGNVLFKRGNTTVASAYTGVPGEIIIDTTVKTIRVQDGSTAGGTRLATYTELGTQSTLANANAATQTTEINSLRANITAANAAITSLQSNAAIQATLLDTLTGNAATQSQVLDTLTSNAATQANTLSTLLGNAVAQQTSLIDLLANAVTQSQQIASVTGTYSNANVATYLSAFDGNILPSANVTYSLGSETRQWKDLWVSNNTIYIGNTPIRVDGGTLLVNGAPVGGGTYANANVATYLPTYTGNIAGNIVKSGYTWTFSNTGTTTFPTGVRLSNARGANTVNFLTDVDKSFQIETQTNVTSKLWNFTTDGNLTLPQNANINFSNGVSILTGLGSSTYGNTQVAAYLPTYTGNVTADYFIGNGSELTNLPAPIVTQDITSNGAMSIMTYDGVIKYANYATVEPSSGNIAAGNVIATQYNFANGVNILSTVAGTYGNTEVAAYLPTYTGNVTAGNLTITGNIAQPNRGFSNGPGTDLYITAGHTQGCSIPGGDTIISGGLGYGGIAWNGGNVTLRTGDYYSKQWNFDYAGNLTIPGSIIGTTTIDIDNRASGNSADIQLYSADDILLQARDRSAGSTSEGGDINIFAGDSAEDSDTSAGDIVIEAGRGGASNIDFGGSGGTIRLESGQGGNAIGANFSARPGGNLTLRAGDAGTNNGNIDLGNSGGDVIINAGDSTANGVNGGTIYLTSGAADASALAGSVVIQAGGTWTFDGNGNLNLPQGGTITEGGGISGAIRLTPAGGANANQALVIYPTAGPVEGDHVHLTAGGGSTELYLGNDTHYVKLVDGGNIELRATTANLSAQASWNFDTTGNIDARQTLGIKVPNGVPTDVAVLNSTTGSWEMNPTLSLATTGGSGSGLTVNVAEAGGYAGTIEIATAGTGYTNGDLITVTSGTSNATFTIVIAGRNTWQFGGTGNLTIPGNINFANGVNILSTVGAGAYGNTQVAAYLPTYTGNITAGNIIANVTPAITSTPVTGVGYIGMPQRASATGTLTIADAGRHVYVTTTGQTITIPANSNVAYPIGTTIAFIGGPSATTTTIAITTDTMYLAGTGTTGSRTLAAYGMATAVKVASTTWYINGSGLT